MDDIIKELGSVLTNGSWVAFAAFGTYLAYKLTFVTVITVGVVKSISKLIDSIKNVNDTTQRINRLTAIAGFDLPLTSEEWEEIENRIRKGNKDQNNVRSMNVA